MPRAPTARDYATRVLNRQHVDREAVLTLAEGYFRKDEEVKKLKRKLVKLEATSSKRISEAYEQGAKDNQSRHSFPDTTGQ